jgi:Holliday junction resolvasome RuvABC ATP-dependent DNA helicase subunit
MRGLGRIIGQTQAVDRLREFANHFSQRGEEPDHILLVGPEGMGKRTIAESLADGLDVAMALANVVLLEKKGDLTVVLTSLEPRTVLFIEDIHRLRQPLKEILIPALRDCRIDLIIGQGPRARIHPYHLSRFTCVATIPRERDLASELREAFPLVLKLQPYSNTELAAIAIGVAQKNSKFLAPAAARLIGDACNGSPHQAELLVSRLTRGDKVDITEDDVRKYLSILGVDFQPQPLTGVSVLDNLSGTEFEILVASLLARMGFRVELTKASGDGGVDIIAVLDKPLLKGRYLIQCKRFGIASSIGAPLVREFYGAVRADPTAVKGIFITTSSFTEQARDFARDLPIDLIDREQLRHLLREYKLFVT